MRAVVTVTGKDKEGIIANVSNELFKYNVNILDIQQNVMEDIFAMVMLVDITKCNVDFAELVEKMNECAKTINMKIHTMHEKIFDSMHRI